MNRATRRRLLRHQPKGLMSPRTGLQLAPVESMSAQALHEELVLDALAGHATNLARAVEAYERIGAQRRCGAEKAYQDVTAEVAALRGRPGMPML